MAHNFSMEDCEKAVVQRLVAAQALLDAANEILDIFNLPEDGSGDRELEPYFRKPVKMLREAVAKAGHRR